MACHHAVLKGKGRGVDRGTTVRPPAKAGGTAMRGRQPSGPAAGQRLAAAAGAEAAPPQGDLRRVTRTPAPAALPRAAAALTVTAAGPAAAAHLERLQTLTAVLGGGPPADRRRGQTWQQPRRQLEQQVRQ